MILVEPVGEVAVIRLDRAAKRNALTPAMLANLCGAVDRASSAAAIVVSGVGDVFCAGFDLTLCRTDDTALEQLLTQLSRAMRTLRRSPMPVVLSAHGAAIAGGCALLGAADIVVTNADARLGYPVVRLGISPAVTAPLLRTAVGDGPARALVLEGELFSGSEALRIGLAHRCVDHASECEPTAIRLAQDLAAKPRHGLAYTKRWLNQLDGSEADAHFDEALRASLSIVNSPEQRERLEKLWSRTSA